MSRKNTKKSADNFLEVAGGVLADRADEVGGQFLALVLIAADDAAPDGLALGSHAHRLGFRFDMFLIIGVGGRRHVRQRFHLHHLADEDGVGAHVHDLHHVGGDEGVGAPCDCQRAVGGPTAVGKIRELVHLASRLEPEVLEQSEVGLFADDGGRKVPGLLDHIVGKVFFIDRDGDAVGLGGHLHHRIGDAAVVAAIPAGRHHKQSVLDAEHWIFTHRALCYLLIAAAKIHNFVFNDLQSLFTSIQGRMFRFDGCLS